MTLGTVWVACLFPIPLFAIVSFAVLILGLRKGALTNLKRTGAIAGLVAGALDATACALHCPDDSLSFMTIWYGAMVVLSAWVGARLGPPFCAGNPRARSISSQNEMPRDSPVWPSRPALDWVSEPLAETIHFVTVGH